MQADFQSGDVGTTRATDRPPTERVSFLTGIRRTRRERGEISVSKQESE